ncbi:hypothetical protein N7520_004311 [Penicillium odoratum]|uniref:uncharacterized protein n=1 Tax=Penicillium odoratum TaxID=1167516 RepID=UPI002547BFCC|nr:uncharacterized protein N7520_004311 [Penicillium odoratum]KAJ5764752.1 hypothetical protein N7520_004311 [Penicillium odoratum]
MPGSVFLIGPGYIGGEILDHLLKQQYSVTTLVRREAAAEDFAKMGVQTVLGTLDDNAVMTQQVAVSDIVIHTATADHLPSVKAVLEGIRQRAAQGQKTIYIHTSGASLCGDDAAGNYASEVIFDDADPAQIDALPDTAPHRLMDLAIVHASTTAEFESHAKIAIMIPPIVYGVNTREKRLSIQLPTLARFALKHGYPGQVGAGLTIWNTVHVADLARGYMTLLHWLEQAPASEIRANPYFFCNNGDANSVSWGACVAEIGRVLHQAGRITDPTPKTIPREDFGDLFADYTPHVVGSNSRNRSTRLQRLGWAPIEKDVFKSLEEDELPIIMKETGVFSGYAKPVVS